MLSRNRGKLRDLLLFFGVLSFSFGTQTCHAQDRSDDVKRLLKERRDLLDKAATYITEVYLVRRHVPLQELIQADRESFKADLDWFDKPADRARAIEKHKEAADSFLRMAKVSFASGRALEFLVLQAKAYVLESQIEPLKINEKGPLLKERRDLLSEAADQMTKLYLARPQDVPLQAMIQADRDSLKADLDWFDKPAERARAIEKHKEAADSFLKMARVSFNAGRAFEALVFQAKTYVLDIQVEFLKGKGQLLKERRDLLSEALDQMTELYSLSNGVTFHELIRTDRDSLKADLDWFDKPEDRGRAIEKHKKNAERFLQTAEVYLAAGRGLRYTVLQAEAHVLEVQIEFLKEKEKQKDKAGK